MVLEDIFFEKKSHKNNKNKHIFCTEQEKWRQARQSQEKCDMLRKEQRVEEKEENREEKERGEEEQGEKRRLRRRIRRRNWEINIGVKKK